MSEPGFWEELPGRARSLLDEAAEGMRGADDRELLEELRAAGPAGEAAIEWLAALRRVERHGLTAREDLAQAEGEVRDEDRSLVRDALARATSARSSDLGETPARGHLSSTRPEAPPVAKANTRARLAWALAAAAVLVALVSSARLWLITPSVDPGTGPSLGTSLELLAPRGRVAEFREFRWKPFELPPGGYFLVEVHDAADELVLEARCGEPRLVLSEAQRARLAQTPEIEWNVHVYSGATRYASGQSQRARRSP